MSTILGAFHRLLWRGKRKTLLFSSRAFVSSSSSSSVVKCDGGDMLHMVEGRRENKREKWRKVRYIIFKYNHTRHFTFASKLRFCQRSDDACITLSCSLKACFIRRISMEIFSRIGSSPCLLYILAFSSAARVFN